MSLESLPPIPPLPTQPAPTLDQRLTHASLLMRVAEYEQRERSIAASAAQTRANEVLAERMLAANGLQLRLLEEGARVNGDDIIAALDRLVAALTAVPDAPAGSPTRVQHLVALLASMPSTQRRNPAAAAAAAAAELSAIQAQP